MKNKHAIMLCAVIIAGAAAYSQWPYLSGLFASLDEPDKWTYEETVDKLTGNTRYDAIRKVDLGNRVVAKMKAACQTEERQAFAKSTYLAIDINFVDDKNNAVEIDRTSLEQDGTGDFRYSDQPGVEKKIPVYVDRPDVLHVLGIGTYELSPMVQNNVFFKAIQDAVDKDDLKNSAKRFAAAGVANIEIPLVGFDRTVIDLKPSDPALRKVLKLCIPSAYASPAGDSKAGQTADSARQQ